MGKRSKYRKDFANFVIMREKKLKRISIILWGIWFFCLAYTEIILKGEPLQSNFMGWLTFVSISIPIIYICGHVALIEYQRGNVNWAIYFLGAPIFYVTWFFMSDEQTRLRYYVDYRKSNK